MLPSKADPGRRNERSRVAILDATMELIGEVGYDDVSIEGIAKRAGVGKQTIYRWWPSKGAVMLEAATHSLDPVVVFPDTGDIVADLRKHFKGIVEMIWTTGFGDAYRGLIAAAQSDPELQRALSAQVIEPNIEAFGRRIALAQERGEVRPDVNVQVLRDLLYGVFEYRIIHQMPTKPRYVDAVLQIAFNGVA